MIEFVGLSSLGFLLLLVIGGIEYFRPVQVNSYAVDPFDTKHNNPPPVGTPTTNESTGIIQFLSENYILVGYTIVFLLQIPLVLSFLGVL